VFGSAYADQIIDNSSGEKLIDGGDGDDYISASGTVESVTIYGGLGSDTIVGGSGNDILIGGDSTSNSGGDYGYFDTLKGGAGNDRIIASSAWSIIEGGSGDDFTSVNFLQSDMSILTFSASYNGGAGNDYLQIKSDMGGVAYEFNVGDGHDYVSMPAWSWRQDGWTGPTLDIYTDTDLSGVTLIWDTTLDSQYSTTPLKSADLAIVFASGDYIFVPGVSGDFTSYNSAYNHLWGINFVGATISELNMVLGSVDAYRLNPADFEDATSPSDDDITGGDDDDDLKGGSGDDSISGGGGNDLIRESGGNDAIEGGDGSDTVMLFGSRADYTLSSSEAGVLVSSQKGLGGTMRLTNVEYVEFIKDGKTFSVGELTGGVHSNHPPFLASSLSDVNVYRGEQIAITIPAGSFGDPDGEPLSYSAAMADGSALPTWLTFANGQFVGTAPALALGLFGVKVTASDGEATVSDTFFLSVGLQTGVLLTAAEISQVGSGNDRVIGGGASNTWIDGLEGDDWLTADNWAVSLNGNDGDDVLEMLGGGGQVRGGAGSDYFIFDGFSATRSSPNTDWGTIEDFEHGTDKIGIVNGTAGLRSFSAILPFMNQNGDDVAISLKGLPVITIQNVQLTALTADDFWFGDWRTDGGFGPPPTAGIVPWPEITRTISLENGEGSNSSERVIGNGAAYKVIDLMDGNDWITTDAWGVSAYGGRGNDVIELAGMGNYAEGGAGYDYFVFDSSKLEFNPWDPDWARIGDYHDGADKIVFLNGTGGFTDFTGLLPYMSQVGDDVVIALNDLPGITIDTTALSSLDATDFLFVAQPSILEAGFDGQQIKIGSTAGLSSVLANGFAEVKIIGTDLANNLDFSQVTLSGIAVIEGHNGDDRIIGSSGADTILGGNDNDTLMGGQGDDVLTGGDGADLFVFDNLSANTFDTITDFESGWDFLGIDKSVFGAFSENTSGVLDASSFEIGGSATGVDAHIIYNETTGELFYDFDGVGGVSQVQIAVFSGLPSISSDMFVVT
jgi:Ca2+-binding RTX toxin-like protein